MGSSVADAARALAAGKLVVYPTDTLYGLGARATDRAAVDRLVRAKGRAAAQPVSVALSSTEEIEPLAVLAPAARRFLRNHLPGPYTVLVRPSAFARRTLAPPIVANPGAIGVRIPDHPVARELARRIGPLTATSANRHGEPPSATIAAARRVFASRVAVYVPDGPHPSGRPSELVDLTGPEPRAIARS